MSKYVGFGDSWSAHELFDLGTGGGIPNALFREVMGVEYEEIAYPGDSTQQLVGLDMVLKLRTALQDCAVCCVTGGGDDFAGPYFRTILNESKAVGGDVSKAVDYMRLSTLLAGTMIDYAEIVAIRDAVNPACLMVASSYDFPPAAEMGHGFLTYGPWLQPGLIDRGWLNPDDQAAIVRLVLLEFEKAMASFAAFQKNYIYVNTQGIGAAAHWANELHKNFNGCMAHAESLNAAILTRQLNG